MTDRPIHPPIALPTVNDVTVAIIKSQGAGGWTPHTAAQAALDLIASRVPVWVPIEPGTAIKAGTRYRIEYRDGRAHEHVASFDRKVDASGPLLIDPRTAPPEDPRVEVLAEEMEAESFHCYDEWPCAEAERFRGAARRAIARLDEMGGDLPR